MTSITEDEIAFIYLINCLKESYSNLSDCKDDCNFLLELLQSNDFKALLQIHNQIQVCHNANYIPITLTSQDILFDLIEDLECLKQNNDAEQLIHLLLKPYMQSILYTHDIIAQKDFLPRLPQVSFSEEDEEETTKIVQLVKSDDSKGATIKSDNVTGMIYIARIMHGGAADRSGLIAVGDIVEEVNNIPVKGKSTSEKSSEGTVLFKILPRGIRCQEWESRIHMKACFDFDPETDKHIPCQEAGLKFTCGDILHIVSQDDPYWWQAQKENQRDLQAGLIPSKALQEKRMQLEKTLKNVIKKDSIYEDNIFECPAPTILPAYVEVMRIYPWSDLHRLIVLLGPPGVGRTELCNHLISSSPDIYKSPILYTSRLPRPHEVPGQNYQFITQQKLEEELREGHYIECLRRLSGWYALSRHSISDIFNEGKIPIITPHCQTLPFLCCAEFKPFVILIKPPDLQHIRETRKNLFARSSFDESGSRGFSDEELELIIQLGDEMEAHHKHECDAILVNDDLDSAVEKLKVLALKSYTEPQWISINWMQ